MPQAFKDSPSLRLQILEECGEGNGTPSEGRFTFRMPGREDNKHLDDFTTKISQCQGRVQALSKNGHIQTSRKHPP